MFKSSGNGNNGLLGKINEILQQQAEKEEGMGASPSISPSSSFERDVLQSKLPVLADVFATWCGPCKQISMHIDRLAAKYKGQVNVVKIDIEHNSSIKQKYAIMGVPTLIMFNQGREVDRLVGAHTATAIEKMIQKYAGEPKNFAGVNGFPERQFQEQENRSELDWFVQRRRR